MNVDFQTWLDSHVFTPTELEAYLLCPFRFYAQAFLALKPPVERDVELTPPELGRLIHRVLERFLSQGQTGVSFDSLRRRILGLMNEEIVLIQAEHSNLSPVLLDLQKRRIERTLVSFVEDRIEEMKSETDLRPRYLEWSFGKNTPPLVIDALSGPPIRVSGRIDRIDVDDASKRFLVIDYKTGSTKTTGNQILSGDSLQLPLYILAVQRLLLPDHEPIGGLFHQLSDMSKKDGLLHADRLPPSLDIHPRSSSLVPGPKWEGVFRGIEDRVRYLVGEIRRGEFTSHPEACEPYCPYQDICRIRSSEEAVRT